MGKGSKRRPGKIPEGAWERIFKKKETAGAAIINRLYEDEIPQSRLGAPKHELESTVTAEECQNYIKTLLQLEAELETLREAARKLIKWHETDRLPWNLEDRLTEFRSLLKQG